MINSDEELSLEYLLSPEFEMINSGGKPLTDGWIEVYIHGTRDKYYCCSDFDGTLHPFQIPLDSLGSNVVLADPNQAYDVYFYNKYGSLIMSRYNVKCQGGGSGGSTQYVGDRLEYGQYSASDVTEVANLNRTQGNIATTSDGKLKLKEDMSYHITIRGSYVIQDPRNTEATVNFIEPTTLNRIRINVDNTITDPQYFELSYDLFKLQYDTDYAIAFETDNGKIDQLTVEVHSLSNLNTTLTGGQPFEQGWGILIEDNVISVDPTIFNDYVTFNDLTQAVTGLHEEITVETTELVCSVSSVLQAEIDNIQQSVQSDWNQTDNTQPDYIKNKPDLDIYATHEEVNGVSSVLVELINDVSAAVPEAQVQSDWTENDSTKKSYIKHKPNLSVYATIETVTSVSSTLQNEIDNIPEQVQSDWTESDTTDPAYIQNKPVPKTLVAGPGIEITDTVTGVEITAAVTAIEGYVTEQEFIEVVSAVTGTGDYGQFYCNTASGACVMGKIKGTIDVTNDGKIKLKKGKSYHISVRGCYRQSSATNVEDTIGFVEYVTNNAIQINVDRTVTSGQYFDLGFDLYNLSADTDYYVFFNGVSNSGVVQDVFVDVHTILGGGSGNGGGGGGAEYNQGWGIVITNNTISVNPNIIPDISNLATKDEVSIAIATATGAQINPDWNNDNPLSKAYIQNKPEELTLVGGNNVEIDIVGASAIINVSGGGGTQVQSDWTEYNPNNPAYIKNKPTIPEDKVYIFWDFEFNRTAIRAAIDAHKVIMDWDRTSNEHRFFTKYEEVTIEGNLCEVYHFAHVETDYTTPYATTWRLGDMAYIYDTVRQVQWAEHDVKMFDHEVPSPTSSDAGKVLTASWDSEQASGSWSWQAAGGGGSGIEYTAGDYIDITNDTISVTGLDNSNIFWAIYNTTSYQDVLDAYNAGKQIFMKDGAIVVPCTSKGGSPDEFKFNGIREMWRAGGPTFNYYSLSSRDGWYRQTGYTLQADWNETNNYYAGYIRNKPDLSAYATVASVTAVADSIPEIELNGNDQVTAIDGHTLAGGGSGTQVQSDWTETNTSDPSYIQNKPEEQMLIAGNNVEITIDGASAIISASASGGHEYTAGPGIEIDNYEISTTELASGLQLVAGNGVTLTVSGNNIVASTDEIVLYDGVNTYVSACTLSESMTNFSTLGIYINNGGGGGDVIQYVSPTTGTHDIVQLFGNNYPILAMVQLTFASNSITATRSIGWSLSWTNTSFGSLRNSSPNELNIIRKVVGINRISS